MTTVHRWLAGDTGGALLVIGGVGAGKSRALRRATTAAVTAGARTAVRRTTELDGLAPLTTVAMTLRTDPWLATATSGLDAAPDRRLVAVDRLSERLCEVARRTPLMVGIDDVDLADEHSLFTIRLLISTLAAERVLWLLTCRTTRGGPADSWEGERAVLGALAPAGVVALAGEILGTPPDDAQLAQLGEAEGDPFVLTSMARDLLVPRPGRVGEGRALAPAPARAEGSGSRDAGPAEHAGPPWLAEPMRWRLRRHPAALGHIVGAGAVIGDPFSVRAVADVLGRPVADVAALVTDAVDDGLLVEQAGRVVFAHPLVRRAVYDGLDVSVRQAWHGAAAEVLRRDGGDGRRMAGHLTRSGPGGRARAAGALREVGRDLGPTDPLHAGTVLCEALDLMEPDDPDRVSTTVEAMGRLVEVDRLEQAVELGEHHLAICADAEETAALIVALAPVLVASGRTWTLLGLVQTVLDRADVPVVRRVELVGMLSYARVLVGDLPGDHRLPLETARQGDVLEAPAAVAWARTAAAMTMLVEGRVEQAVSEARRAAAATRHAGAALAHQRTRIVLALALTLAGRLDEADAVALTAEREIGSGRVGRSWALARRAAAAWRAGRAEEARTEAGTALACCEGEAEPTVSLLVLRALCRLRLGDPVGARADLDRATSRWRATGLLGHPSVLYASLVLDTHPHTDPDPDTRPVADLTTRARRVVAALAARPGLLLAFPDAPSTLLLIARRTADADLADAVHVHVRRLAELNPGLSPLTTATDAPPASSGGAGGTTGSVAAPPHPDEDPEGGGGVWDVLTAAETRVARLAADGMTNKSIARRLAISRHTVDSHLRQTYAKLGVAGRVELAVRLLGPAAPHDGRGG